MLYNVHIIIDFFFFHYLNKTRVMCNLLETDILFSKKIQKIMKNIFLNIKIGS